MNPRMAWIMGTAYQVGGRLLSSTAGIREGTMETMDRTAHDLAWIRLLASEPTSLGGGVNAKSTTGIRFGEREPVPEIDTHQGVRGSGVKV